MSTSGGLQDFGTDLPINVGINLPQPQLVAKTGYYVGTDTAGAWADPQLWAFWDSNSTNNDWTSQVINPRYFLYRKRRAKKRITPGFFRNSHRWAHPTHHNGVNYPGSHMFGGQQTYNDGSNSANIPDRETEWDIDLTPRTPTQILLNPGDWFGYFDLVSGNFLTKMIQFPVEYNLWGNEDIGDDPWLDDQRRSTRITGRGGAHNLDQVYSTPKALTFCLKIVCENPNWDGTPNTQRYFIGPSSDVFQIKPIIRSLTYDPGYPVQRPQFTTTDYMVEWRINIVTGYNNT